MLWLIGFPILYEYTSSILTIWSKPESQALVNSLVKSCSRYLSKLHRIQITNNSKSSFNILVNILKNPLSFKKEIDLQTIKDKIYLLRNLDKIYDVEESETI